MVQSFADCNSERSHGCVDAPFDDQGGSIFVQMKNIKLGVETVQNLTTVKLKGTP
jgi:hypothetical protein